ncbi:hypothetical protein KEM55_003219 [Ascosphaera atra]|nr:hypothetical protein KEM55_003219 [Ascosphaera atra]
MCGRYALGMPVTEVRRHLQRMGRRVDEAPDDNQVRETYNFAPGNFGVVYRAEIGGTAEQAGETEQAKDGDERPSKEENGSDDMKRRYKLQAMKWGLVPFWTKKEPTYGNLMRTINCRDDSLREDRGMWSSMKKTKRCVVVCTGYYEWLKKGPKGKEKVPHYFKRKDGNLLFIAGLWDSVKYEGSSEELFTYTVITTTANKHVSYIHDRMPAILEPGEETSKWLDPSRKTWTPELQSLLKPYEGELEWYPVPKEVGKVGNDSPEFILPVKDAGKDGSKKGSITNFFGVAAKQEKGAEKEKSAVKREHSPERLEENEHASKLTKKE